MHEKKQERSWKHMVKPSSPQKGTGVFAKGLNPVPKVSHRASVRLRRRKKGGLSASCTPKLKDPNPLNKIFEPNPPSPGSTKEMNGWLNQGGQNTAANARKEA